MRDRPLVQLTLARMREFYREPEAIFWVFGFPLVLAFALGIAFRNRGPGELKIGLLRAPGDSVIAAALDRSPALAAAVLDSGEARTQFRTGRIALLVVPGDPLVYRYDSTRTESRLARLEADEALQRARGRPDVASVRDERVTEPGSRYIDFLIPGLLGMNLMGSGLWGVGFSVVQARTKKLLKRFMATPMRRSHYLLSFILSRLLFLFLEIAALVGFGWLMFGVAVRGSFGALALKIFRWRSAEPPEPARNSLIRCRMSRLVGSMRQPTCGGPRWGHIATHLRCCEPRGAVVRLAYASR